MKRSRARRGAAFLAVCVLLAAGRAGAQHAPTLPPPAQRTQGGIPFAVALAVGAVRGAATELAFDYPLGRKFKISELDWDIDAVAVGGVQASFPFWRRLSFNFGIWRSLAEGSGEMVDRDWMYSEAIAAGLIAQDAITDDDWTHQSRHPDTTIDAAWIYDANLSAELWRSGGLSLSGLLGCKVEDWQWSSRGGSFVYSVNGFRDLRGRFPPGLTVIEYEQTYALPYLGVGAAWERPALRLEAHLLASRWASASDTDHHVLRDTVFEGTFSGGSYVGVGAAATWFFGRGWYATAALEHERADDLTGDVTANTPEGTWTFGGGGGVDLRTTALTVGAGRRF